MLRDRWKPPTFVALDLTQRDPRESLLACPNYDSAASTLFVAEGLLMYLTEAEVTEILGVVRTSTGPKSSILFTFMDEQRPGHFQFRGATRMVDFWLRLKHENFVWGSVPTNSEPSSKSERFGSNLGRAKRISGSACLPRKTLTCH